MATAADVNPLDVSHDIVPLFAMVRGGDSPTAFLGTGFLATTGILVTCWHCVRDAVAQGLDVVAVTQTPDRKYRPHLVSSIEQDATGTDLASAKVDLVATVRLTIAEGSIPIGSDVWTYGYPLTDAPNERRPSWMLEGRYLQGYVTRQFYFSEAHIPSYELDMRAPAGLSGAPIVQVPSRSVVGVVYGVNDVRRIEEYARTDPETGEIWPGLHRVESFALAHFTESLRNLAGAATGGVHLSEYVAQATADAEEQLRHLYPRGQRPTSA